MRISQIALLSGSRPAAATGCTPHRRCNLTSTISQGLKGFLSITSRITRVVVRFTALSVRSRVSCRRLPPPPGYLFASLIYPHLMGQRRARSMFDHPRGTAAHSQVSVLLRVSLFFSASSQDGVTKAKGVPGHADPSRIYCRVKGVLPPIMPTFSGGWWYGQDLVLAVPSG